MTETFKKLKKKYLLLAIIKSIIAGVFSALFCVGAVMLGIKLGAVWMASYYYVIIALGGFAIAFGITFLLTRHTNKSLSRLLDFEYGLNEKVQTMVEFSEQEGDMLKIQREDAENRLKNLPKKKLSFAKIWQYILVAVLGLSIFLTGILLPSKFVAPTVPDDFTLSDWDLKVLEQLISEVKSSDLKDEVMIPSVTALELLKDQLTNAKTNAEMRESVRNCAKAIDKAVVLANTYRDIALRLNAYTGLADFTRALVSACDSYKQSNDVEINSMSVVKACSQASEERIRAQLSVFTNSFIAKVKNLTADAEIKNAVEAFLNPFNESMVEDGAPIEALAEDELYLALADFSTRLTPVVEEYGLFVDYMKSIVSDSCSTFISSASKVLVEQVYNRIMDDYIFNRLADIFSVTLTQDELDLPGISGGDIGPGDGSSSGGGAGDGDVVYGGNDAVYDPNSAEHVPYGEVWNDYVAKLYERINDKQSGLSKEMEAYILEYINILDGSASENEGD